MFTMNSLRKGFGLLFILLLKAQAFAGWSSGGGELIRDQNNPWFLKNTTTVKYCIDIDEAVFGQSKEKVRERIAKAILFWQNQLQDLEYSSYQGFDTKLGTQNFSEEFCQESTDLRFQMGKLTTEQKQILGETKDIVGLTLRTQYDSVFLRGKGFVYIAPQSGSLKPDLTESIENMWSVANGSYLFAVLIHELGHVFGLQHSNEVQAMAEDWVEFLLAKANQELLSKYIEEFDRETWVRIKLFKFSIFNSEKLNLSVCSFSSTPIVTPIKPSPKTNQKKRIEQNKKVGFLGMTSDFSSVYDQFFGVPAEAICRGETVIDGKLVISYQLPHSNEWRTAGSMPLQNAISTWADRVLVKLWLPREQRVFPNSEGYNVRKFDLARMYSKISYKGNYTTSDGKTVRRLIADLSPSGNRKMSGTLNGEIYEDLVFGY